MRCSTNESITIGASTINHNNWSIEPHGLHNNGDMKWCIDVTSAKGNFSMAKSQNKHLLPIRHVTYWTSLQWSKDSTNHAYCLLGSKYCGRRSFNNIAINSGIHLYLLNGLRYILLMISTHTTRSDKYSHMAHKMMLLLLWNPSTQDVSNGWHF